MTSYDDSQRFTTLDDFGERLVATIEPHERSVRRRRFGIGLAVLAAALPVGIAGAQQLAGGEMEVAADTPAFVTDQQTWDGCEEILRQGKNNFPCIVILRRFAPDQLPSELPPRP